MDIILRTSLADNVSNETLVFGNSEIIIRNALWMKYFMFPEAKKKEKDFCGFHATHWRLLTEYSTKAQLFLNDGITI